MSATNVRGAAGVPMGAPRPTGPTMQQARAFQQYEEANIQQPWQNPTRSGYPSDSPVNQDRFPSVYFARDPYDTVYEAKQQIVSNGGMYGNPQIPLNANAAQIAAANQVKQVIPITDADVQYALGRQERDEYAQFKVWAEQWFDLGDPAQVRLFEEAFPDYYEDRASLIKNLGDNMTKFAILRLLGPRTRDDFMFLWLVQTGKVPLITGPLWKPESWADEGPAKKLALFNPWRAVTASNAPNTVNRDNRTDPVGFPGRSYPNVANQNTGTWLHHQFPTFSGVAGWQQLMGLNAPNLNTWRGPMQEVRPGNPLAFHG